MFKILGVMFVIIVVFGGVTSYEKSKMRKVAEEAAMRERIKAELKAEMAADRVSQPQRQASVPASLNADVRAENVSSLSGSANIDRRDKEELKMMLRERLAKLDQQDKENGVLGASSRIDERRQILRQLTDLEIVDKGGSSSSYEGRQLRRAQEDLRDEVERLRLDIQRR